MKGPIGVASSQPAAPCTTHARSIGIPAKVCAISTRGGLVVRTDQMKARRGRDWSAVPSRLNTVRTPSAARIGASAFIAG